VCVLVALAVVLAAFTRRCHSAPSSVLAFAAWCSFGLMATYHRAHDALILMGLLPWVCLTIGRGPRRWVAWVMLVLLGVLTSGIEGDTLMRLAVSAPPHSVAVFLLLHQAALANLLLLLALLFALRGAVREVNEHRSLPA